MKILSAIILFSVTSFSYSDEKREDLIRFVNGDQLHGDFYGLKSGPSISWKRGDMDDEVGFKSSELRQIILNEGRPERALSGLGHIGTINGDRFPGVITSLNDKELILETDYAGVLSIPRSKVGLLAPNPLGGRIIYQGPFEESEWTMINLANQDGLLAEQKKEKDEEADPVWNFSGSAWYWEGNKMGTALVKKSGIPDKAVIRFDLAWKGRLALAIAFHADFENPGSDKVKEEQLKNLTNPDHPNYVSLLFGSSYILQLHSHYTVLWRSIFNEEKNPNFERVQTSNTSVRMGDSGSSSIELRCNRITGEIILFIDGEFVVQWSELPNEDGGGKGYVGKGGGIGFFAQSDESAVRISELLIAEWNGMPDAAKSLQVDDSDIVLLSNGTDRVSGKVTSIEGGTLELEGRYGDFQIPMNDVAEVRFGRASLDKSDEGSEQMKMRFYPLGRISGQPISGDSSKLKILSDVVGEMEVSLESAVMLEFKSAGNFIDDWDNDF